MTKVLLFDADGVMTLPEEAFSIVYSRSHGFDPEPFEEFFKTQWQDFVTGKSDLLQHIRNNPDFWHWQGAPEDLLKYWFEAEDIKNDELIDLIRRYRAEGRHCYLATEQEKYRGDYMENVMFPGLFDGFFVTAELGVKKDKPEFYHAIIATLQADMPDLTPGDITFFDDSQSKVDSAHVAGINAVLYTGIDSVQAAISAS